MPALKGQNQILDAYEISESGCPLFKGLPKQLSAYYKGGLLQIMLSSKDFEKTLVP